jgi:ribosome biogenesis GTPase
MTDILHGTVIKSTGSWYTVQTPEGERVRCRIRGKFRTQGIKSTNPIAVGDRIKFYWDGETGVIIDIEPRKNYIPRKSVKLSKQVHILAANIDRIFLIITVQFPRTLTAFIDRFLATAEAYDIETILVFNKTDLYNEKEKLIMREWVDIYSNIGYTCLEISALRKTGIDRVKDLMKNRVSVFAGHSGTGKSTLINAIEPHLNLRTHSLTKTRNQGTHTTTYAEMHSLSFGGYIIDTPGIKGFGVVDFSEEETGDYFREIFAIKSGCKFHNCRHINEPDCAVIKAVENGEIALSRYLNYLDILTGEEGSYR